MKKIINLGIIAIIFSLFLTGCGTKSNELTLSVSQIADQIYDGIDTDDLPKLGTTEITKDNMESYLGVSDLNIKEAVASEPMMSSIAHSVVIVQLKDKSDVDKAVEEIKEKANPRKWICVEADQVIVKSRGDIIILIMSSNDLAPQLEKNFDNLK